MKALACLLLLSTVAFGQAVGPTTTSLPSNQEITELVNKAAEKVTQYQMTLNATKSTLDRVDPDFYKQYSEACDTALFTIKALRQNGPSAYALVSLVSILDDLSLDASRASTRMVLHNPQSPASSTDVLSIATAGANCYDISELLLHATLRYRSVEESLLNQIVSQQK